MERQLVGPNGLHGIQDAHVVAQVGLAWQGRLIVTAFLVVQQSALVTKYFLPHDEHTCTVYKMNGETCPWLWGLSIAQALTFCGLFMLFVCSVGQDAMRRTFQHQSRLFFLLLGLLCSDLVYAVTTNGGYFVQPFVNVFGYLLFACAAVFEVQFGSAIICGGGNPGDNDPMRCLWQTCLVLFYYFVLIENFIAMTIIDENIPEVADNNVGALIQVALEIAVVVEVFLLPLFAAFESDHGGNASESRIDVLSHRERFRCRVCLSLFIVIEFIALRVKYLVPARSHEYDCAVYKLTHNGTCHAQFIMALVQSIAYPTILCLLVCHVRTRGMRLFASLNRRLLCLCAFLTMVNVMYLVSVQLPEKEGAYTLQVIVDPLAAIIEGLTAVLEVQHWGKEEHRVAGFVWRLLLTISYIVLLVSYIIITVRLDSALDAASGAGEEAKKIAFAHVLVETATVIECLLLALFDSHKVVDDPQ